MVNPRPPWAAAYLTPCTAAYLKHTTAVGWNSQFRRRQSEPRYIIPYLNIIKIKKWATVWCILTKTCVVWWYSLRETNHDQLLGIVVSQGIKKDCVWKREVTWNVQIWLGDDTVMKKLIQYCHRNIGGDIWNEGDVRSIDGNPPELFFCIPMGIPLVWNTTYVSHITNMIWNI